MTGQETSFEQPVRVLFCDLCGKGFSSRNKVQRHRLIHTGERPYICELCEMAFNDKSALRRHQKHFNHYLK